jgi:diguanylate cyclase (GGDEF)-like protein
MNASASNLPTLSRPTVATMIQLFDSMYRRPTPLVPPMFDIEKLSNVLYGMGFDMHVIETYNYRYAWDFKSIFPSLEDGTFFNTNATEPDRENGKLHLLGFAVFACGAFHEYPQMRSDTYHCFEKSLLKDGYRFDGLNLVEATVTTSVVADFTQLPDKKRLVKDVSSLLQNDTCVCVVFIDLDHFKQVNDQLRHEKGNECLSAVARTISEVTRHRGTLYRIGGDEFCALLPNISIGEAKPTAERIRKAIDDLEPFGGKVKVTTSVGIASSDRKELSEAQALIDAADEAMYVSKAKGKNCVSVWPPDEKEAALAAEHRKRALAAAPRR